MGEEPERDVKRSRTQTVVGLCPAGSSSSIGPVVTAICVHVYLCGLDIDEQPTFGKVDRYG